MRTEQNELEWTVVFSDFEYQQVKYLGIDTSNYIDQISEFKEDILTHKWAFYFKDAESYVAWKLKYTEELDSIRPGLEIIRTTVKTYSRPLKATWTTNSICSIKV